MTTCSPPVLLAVTVSNQEFAHSEIDIEFYGNTFSNLIQLSLNVYADGHQNLAQVRGHLRGAVTRHSGLVG